MLLRNNWDFKNFFQDSLSSIKAPWQAERHARPNLFFSTSKLNTVLLIKANQKSYFCAVPQPASMVRECDTTVKFVCKNVSLPSFHRYAHVATRLKASFSSNPCPSGTFSAVVFKFVNDVLILTTIYVLVPASRTPGPYDSSGKKWCRMRIVEFRSSSAMQFHQLCFCADLLLQIFVLDPFHMAVLRTSISINIFLRFVWGQWSTQTKPGARPILPVSFININYKKEQRSNLSLTRAATCLRTHSLEVV